MVLINQIMSVLYLCIVIGLVSMLADNPCFRDIDKVRVLIFRTRVKHALRVLENLAGIRGRVRVHK